MSSPPGILPNARLRSRKKHTGLEWHEGGHKRSVYVFSLHFPCCYSAAQTKGQPNPSTGPRADVHFGVGASQNMKQM